MGKLFVSSQAKECAPMHLGSIQNEYLCQRQNRQRRWFQARSKGRRARTTRTSADIFDGGRKKLGQGGDKGNERVWFLRESGEVVRELPSQRGFLNALGLDPSIVSLYANGKIDYAARYSPIRKRVSSHGCNNQPRQPLATTGCHQLIFRQRQQVISSKAEATPLLRTSRVNGEWPAGHFPLPAEGG